MSVASDGLRLAVGTLSRMPIPPPTRVDAAVARVAMLAAPLAVVPLGIVWAVAHLAVRDTRAPALLVGAAMVAVTAYWSRGLHLDGLADTCDGLSASYDRERAHAVMKSGDVGPSGAVALALVVLVQAAALGALLASWSGTVLALVGLLVSRHALAWGCAVVVPVARADGLGAGVGRSVGPISLCASAFAVLALSAAAVLAVHEAWYDGPLLAAVGLVAAALVLRTATVRLGGMSGDVLGAEVEMALTASLACATLLV